MKQQITAALALASIFTLSCGQHNWEDIFLDSSSSEEEEYSSSSSFKVSSSSLQSSSGGGSLPQSSSGKSSDGKSGSSSSQPSQSSSGKSSSSSGKSGSSSSSRGSSSGGNRQGFAFDENSQIYERDCHYDEYADYICEALPYADDGYIKAGGLGVGTVTNGIASLQLPAIPDQDLEYFLDEEEAAYYCTDYEENIKVFYADFAFAGNGYTAELGISDEQDNRGIVYWYFSKAGKISCDWANDYSDYSSQKMDLNVSKGWNKIYYRYIIVDEDYNYTTEYTTSNILVNPVMWFIRR